MVFDGEKWGPAETWPDCRVPCLDEPLTHSSVNTTLYDRIIATFQRIFALCQWIMISEQNTWNKNERT